MKRKTDSFAFAQTNKTWNFCPLGINIECNDSDVIISSEEMNTIDRKGYKAVSNIKCILHVVSRC